MVFTSPFPSLDVPGTNILSYLFPPGETPSDEPIWIDSENDAHSLSPRQLLAWVRRLAYGLERRGLRRGDVVLICTPNHIFVPVAYLGIVGAGYIFSGANPAYTVSELRHQMENTSARVILSHPSKLADVLAAADAASVPRDRIFQFSDTHCLASRGIPDWGAMLAPPDEAAAYQWPELSPREAETTVATINYSSGTTGLPKGVCVSHRNLRANVEQTVFMRYAGRPVPHPKERWIGFLPLYHAYGQLYTMLMAVRLNVPVYIMREFRYEDFLAAISRYRITTLQVAPPILVMLAKRPETARHDISSVRDLLCGGAPLSRDLQNECQRRFGVQINQGWGMTEVTCGALTVPGGVRDDSGSVGQIFPSCECRLVDDDGRDVAVGAPGELLVRGPNVCLGYWRNEAATKEVLDADGWLHSGDVAVCDDRGFFWIVDRKKELIKVNALQVAPAELEAVLLENEHVADAAVVGITTDGEEKPRAYVTLQDASRGRVTPEAIQSWMSSRVAKHKRLTGGVVFVDEVPRLASGKIQRKVMREWAKRDASIEEQRARARL